MKTINLLFVALLTLIASNTAASSEVLLDNNSKPSTLCKDDLRCKLTVQNISYILNDSKLMLMNGADVRDTCLIIDDLKLDNINLIVNGNETFCL